MLDHYEGLLSHYGVEQGNRIARKHLAWYSRSLPGSADFRARINREADPTAVRDAIAGLYQRALEDRLAA